jgi:hypothetical protein
VRGIHRGSLHIMWNAFDQCGGAEGGGGVIPHCISHAFRRVVASYGVEFRMSGGGSVAALTCVKNFTLTYSLAFLEFLRRIGDFALIYSQILKNLSHFWCVDVEVRCPSLEPVCCEIDSEI